jgi:hypothetical protein
MEPTSDQTAEGSDFLYERIRQVLTFLEKAICSPDSEHPPGRQEDNPIPLLTYEEYSERAKKQCEKARADCALIKQGRETLRADHRQMMEHSAQSITKSKVLLASMASRGLSAP